MEYRNAKYLEAEGWIDCEINHPVYGWIPYSINPADTDTTVDNAELLALMAERNDVAPYVPPSQEELDAEAILRVRKTRDMLLYTEVDAIAGNALRWAALTPEKQAEWATYRQELLDVPQQTGFPHDVVWPVKPE